MELKNKNTELMDINEHTYIKVSKILPLISTSDQTSIKSIKEGKWLSIVDVDMLCVLFSNHKISYFPLQIRKESNIMKYKINNNGIDAGMNILKDNWNLMNKDADFWLFSMYPSLNHFVTIIFDLKSRRLYFIDSLSSSYYYNRTSMAWVDLMYACPYEELRNTKLIDISSEYPIQNDGNNCGLFPMIIMDMLSSGISLNKIPTFDYSKINFGILREKVANLLEHFTKDGFKKIKVNYDLSL